MVYVGKIGYNQTAGNLETVNYVKKPTFGYKILDEKMDKTVEV